MNRKKAILLWSSLESMLLAMLLVLFISGSLPLRLFIAVVVLLAVVSLAVVMVIIRKIPQ
jgi:hypothetical protein